jgi:hypothetical protein
MKQIVKVALSLVFMGVLNIAAAEDTTVTTSTTVDAEIAAIQAATPQERVALMNEFKERLMNMNEAERSEAIAQMQATMQSQRESMASRADGAMQTMEQRRTQTQSRAQNMQMQANEAAVQAQTMNQMRVGTQMANMPANPPVDIAPGMGGGASKNHATPPSNFNINRPISH